ncbi:MAG: carbamoyl-phosphate synthase large subunit [Synergistales bacterium]
MKTSMEKTIQSVLVLGSGPIRIGQAAEFDYSGSQACRALQEEGVRVILLNSNPATIQTDPGLAEVIYLRPLTPEVIEDILKAHRPDGVIATLGGQTALNLLVELHRRGTWERYGTLPLGTPPETVDRAEGREPFRDLMKSIGEPVVESRIVMKPQEALEFAKTVPFPLVIRPDFTLGGTGGGVAFDEGSLVERVLEGVAASPTNRVLVERYLSGWYEVELEIVRDGFGNALCVCGMENVDPMGIHTGDSVVVAPVLTLSDNQWQRLRTAALHIVEALDVRGACNVQFAASPDMEEYAVIEVNPRASRSSALASKATGYPIARLAAKIALGKSLAEMPNPVTGVGSALSEPALDYVAVKFPRWPFDKFPDADPTLGTRMKSTGEVLALGPNFAQALLKAMRSVEWGGGLRPAGCSELPDRALWAEVGRATHRRLWFVFELLRRGEEVETLAEASGISPFFLRRMKEVVEAENRLSETGLAEFETLARAKRLGLADRDIASLLGLPEAEVRARRLALGIEQGYREVDGCAGETPAGSKYLYGAYGVEGDGSAGENAPAVVVLGSGPIRIGQGVEFDYCCVKAVEALKTMGIRAVMANNNPETVSTDHDLSDALYLEPLTVEDALPIVGREKARGVFASYGGQTALKLGMELAAAGVPLLGTGLQAIEAAEDRGQFSAILKDLGIAQPEGGAVRSVEEALGLASRLGYPLMVRPSFVIGGLAMALVESEPDLRGVLALAFEAMPGQAVLVDRFVSGTEYELDAVCDGGDILVPGIFEHLDPAGIHSGDSMAVFPDLSLSPARREEMMRIVASISEALDVRGLLNVQFVENGGKLYVIEANPRASRTVPIAGKLTGIPLVDLSVRVSLGQRLRNLGVPLGLLPPRGPLGVKVPVFSTEKLPGVDSRPGPQMQSTGESLGVGECVSTALWEGIRGAGWALPDRGRVLVSVNDASKAGACSVAATLFGLGWEIEATAGTSVFFRRWGLPAAAAEKGESLVSALRERRWDLVVNVAGSRLGALKDGYAIRRAAIETGIPCVNSLPVASALALALAVRRGNMKP